jgi:TIR domain
MIAQALMGHFEEVFLDIQSISPGQSWRKVIDEAIASCRAVVSVIGPHWLGAGPEQGKRALDDPADIVRRELEVALELGVPVIPVLVDGAKIPARDELPESLSAIADLNAFVISPDAPDPSLSELAESMKSVRGFRTPGAPRDAPGDSVLDVPEPRPDQAPSTQSLNELMAKTGLKFIVGDDGVLRIPFEAPRAGEVVVYGREFSEADVHFFAVYLSETGWREKRSGELDRGLLQASFAATYVKAMVIDSQFLLAAEIPTSILTPSIAEGLVRALARLGDLQKGDMREEGTWDTVVQGAAYDQATYTDLNPDQLREETLATLSDAGLDPREMDGNSYLVKLDIVEDQPLNVAVRPHQLAVSLIAGFVEVRPKNKRSLRQLLEINGRANVAKVGIDNSGRLAFLYEVPHLLGPQLEQAKSQFTQLLVELINSNVVES